MLTIGVIADIRYGNPTLDTLKLEKILVYLNHTCDYIVLLGDITNSGATKEFESIKSILDNIVKKAKLVPVIGNHDCYKSNRLSKPDDRNFVRAFIDDINKLDGNRYLLNYTFVIDEKRIMCLDFNSRSRFNGLRADIDEDQLKWIDSVLSEDSYRTYIFAHTPLHSPFEAGWQSEILPKLPTFGLADFTLKEYNRICRVLKPYSKKITFWMAGHGHVDKQANDKNAGIDVIEIASFFKQDKYKVIIL